MTFFLVLPHFLLLCVSWTCRHHVRVCTWKNKIQKFNFPDTSITQKFFLDLVKQNLSSPLNEHTYSLNVTKCRSNFHPSDWLSGAPEILHSESFKGLERKLALASLEARKSRLIIDILISDLKEIEGQTKQISFTLIIWTLCLQTLRLICLCFIPKIIVAHPARD